MGFFWVILRCPGIYADQKLLNPGQKASGDAVVELHRAFVAAVIPVLAAIMPSQGGAVPLGPLAGGAQDEGGDGVELVGDAAESKPPGLEGDGAAAGGDVQHQGVVLNDALLHELSLLRG